MSKTVLIIDDLATMRASVRYSLSAAGYAVVEAESGEKAIEALKGNPSIDMILSDWTMPDMDGLALLGEILKNEDWKRIPFVMLIMESQLPRKEELRAAGAAGWIIKPFMPEQLCSVVGKLVA